MGTQGGTSMIANRKKKQPSREHHNINVASIDKAKFSFNTRTFMIRYCEEEVRS
jgi:hypothetical protein